VEADGAVLVRPDGYVCWRSRGDRGTPGEVLAKAFDKVIGRG
jgi:putative polyketide hydroxylase